MAEDNSSFLNYVNSSGFAFQMRIEEEILKGPNRWRLAGREHRWQDESGQSGYIDLLIDFGALRVLIDCKSKKIKIGFFLRLKAANIETGVRFCGQKSISLLTKCHSQPIL